jgi:hypothetical protein
MAAIMTYDGLVQALIAYTERDNDTQFVAQVPWFVMLGEARIYEEFRGLGLQVSVTSSFVPSASSIGGIVQKPDRWRETISWNYSSGVAPVGNSTARSFLLERSLEYCRTYAPDPTQLNPPKYFADYSWSNWLVVPSPDLAYPFEVLYYEQPQTLSSSNEQNWTTIFAPNLLFASCMVQANLFLKIFDNRSKIWTDEYDRAANALGLEKKKQTVDRSAVVDKE